MIPRSFLQRGLIVERAKFILHTFAASCYLLFGASRHAEAKDKDDGGFTMTSGPMLGGANGTGGA
jgi:hypothetical protein